MNTKRTVPVDDLQTSDNRLSVSSLQFDDAPIDSLLKDENAVESTPVDVIKLWEKGDHSDVVAQAVASRFISDETTLTNITYETIWDSLIHTLKLSADKDEDAYVACADALSKLAEGKCNYQDAEYFLTEVIRSKRNKLEEDHTDILIAQLRLATILKELGKNEISENMYNAAWFKLLLLENKPLLNLRQLARSFLLAGEYTKARLIYQHLVDNGFEVASTYCHLARLCLMTNDFKSMSEYANQAWSIHEGADNYVVPRILFFILTGRMLAGQFFDDVVCDISKALQKPNVSLEWTMSPVLELHKSRLSPDCFNLLTALIGALNNSTELDALKALPLWRNAVDHHLAPLSQDSSSM